MMNGGEAKVVLLKQPGFITVSVSASSDAKRQPNWSGIKVWACRYPFSISGDVPVTLAYGETNLAMPLVNTFKNGGKTETAVFTLRADPSLVGSLSDIGLTSGDNACWFSLPLDREAVLVRFKSRSSEAELSEFEELRNSNSTEDRQHALEMVLFKLTAAELKRIGIHQHLTVPPTKPVFWDIAGQNTCAPDYLNEEAKFSEVLRRANCPASIGIGNLCGITWVVDREKFFQARDALLAAKRAKLLGKTTSVVVEPGFQLE